ncbi:MAG: hypothetical protein AB1597_00990 [Chloroflexota bacterium]
MVDAMISVFILGVVVVAFTMALSTGAAGAGEADQQGIAQGIAMSQLEYVKNLAYVSGSGSYPSIPVPSGWAVSAERSAIPQASGNPDIQKVTVTVTRSGVTILTLEDYKVNR